MNARKKASKSTQAEAAPETVTADSESGHTESVETSLRNLSLAQVVELAQRFQDQGQLQAADQVYTHWLAAGHTKGRHLVLFNHGAMLQSMGQAGRALTAYQEALQIDPGFGQACINMGLLLERLNESDRALQVWGQYLGQRFLKGKFDPELQCTALNHMGRVHEGRKHYDLAESALEQSLAINPKQPGVIQHWVHIRQKACKWPVYKALPGISHSEMLRCTSPLAMLALEDDPLRQLVTAQSFVTRTYSMQEQWLCNKNRKPGAQWRIGLVSADLREHAVGFLIPAFIRGLDRQRYSLHAYDYTKEEDTPLRHSLKKQFDSFTEIGSLNDRQAAERIAADEIDVLIDLHGLSSGARPGIFALHPAPRQMTYLGYIGSTGMPWFDHVIVDPVAMPQSLASHFIEQPIYTSGSFIPLTIEKKRRAKVTREEVQLPLDAFVMAAFVNVYKITEDMFASWMRILKRIPNAVLWMIDDNEATTQNLREAALLANVDPARLICMPRCDHETFCARLKLADVYLDSYPYNCGSTTNDVINAGVPLVTRYGDSLVSRMGLSILSELGQADLATRTPQDYEDKVVEVALRLRLGQRYSYTTQSTSKLQSVLDQLRDAQRNENVLQLPSEHSAQRYALHSVRKPKSTERDDDWALHTAVQDMLLHTQMDNDTLYGYFTPETARTTGLSTEDIENHLTQQQQAGHAALLYSPFWDAHSLFRNPFLAQAHQLGADWLEVAQSFVNHAGYELDLSRWVVSTHRSVHGMAFLARRQLWFRWLQLATQLREAFDNEAHPLQDALHTQYTCEATEISAAEGIYPLLMNLVMHSASAEVNCLSVYTMPPKHTNASEIYPFALSCEALKTSYLETGSAEYLALFDRSAAIMVQRLWPNQ